MDPMTMAKKSVLKDLIREMQKKMVAMGQPVEQEAPEDGTEETESEPSFESEAEAELCEECSKTPCECEDEPAKDMTISLAAIKKAPKPAGKMPAALEEALMGKDSKFKKKA